MPVVPPLRCHRYQRGCPCMYYSTARMTNAGGQAPLADASAIFMFDGEVCAGLLTLRHTHGVLDDGLGGSASGAYGGVGRNCSWLLRPNRVQANIDHVLIFTLISVELRADYDELTIRDGDGRTSSTTPVLLRLPTHPTTLAAVGVRPDGCLTLGVCLHTFVAKSGSGTIQLRSLPRADGTSSRLSLRFVSVYTPSETANPGSLIRQVRHLNPATV